MGQEPPKPKEVYLVDKDNFTRALKKAGVLLGLQGVTEDMRDAFYEELQGEPEKNVLSALRSVAYNGERLTLTNINKYLIDLREPYWQRENERLRQQNKEAMERLREQDIPQEAQEAVAKLFGKNWSIRDVHTEGE